MFVKIPVATLAAMLLMAASASAADLKAKGHESDMKSSTTTTDTKSTDVEKKDCFSDVPDSAGQLVAIPCKEKGSKDAEPNGK